MPQFAYDENEMRFETKFDRGLMLLLVIGAAVTLPLPWVIVRAPRWLAFLPWLIWAYVLLSTLPQYYEILATGLYIRQGVRKALIAYADLVEVTPLTESRSAGVFSLDRVEVVTRQSRAFVIAPRDQECFLEELHCRAPQLRRKGFGIGVGI